MTSVSKSVRYICGGLLIGGFWYLNRERPPWEEALRTIAVFSVLMVVLKSRLKHKSVDVHLVPLIASKATLVVIAAVAEGLLRPSAGDPALVVAIGLGLAVALLGPLGDAHYFVRREAVPAVRPAQPAR